MRLIRNWPYGMGTNPPFSEWPELVHRFLDRHGLNSGAFLYFFEDQLSAVSCSRALKACPAFGAPRLVPGSRYGSFDTLILSNIDTGGGCTEEELLPLMKRIHRSWGFSTSAIYYYDVDFFGEEIPWMRRLESIKEFSALHHQPFEPRLFLDRQPFGSGVKLERYCWGKQEITFSIDLLHHGEVLDPAPYVETMKELLPYRRPQEYLEIYYSEEEQREYAARQAAAEPMAEECRAWLARRLPKEDGGISTALVIPHILYQMAPTLKSLAKKYGFTYRFVADGYFTLSKQTAQGHWLQLTADSGPYHSQADFWLEFKGLGFSHRLHTATFHPTDQAGFDNCAEQVAAVAAAFAEEALIPLSQYYPETPDWYQAN